VQQNKVGAGGGQFGTKDSCFVLKFLYSFGRKSLFWAVGCTFRFYCLQVCLGGVISHKWQLPSCFVEISWALFQMTPELGQVKDGISLFLKYLIPQRKRNSL
jgi:hypothetical protein